MILLLKQGLQILCHVINPTLTVKAENLINSQISQKLKHLFNITMILFFFLLQGLECSQWSKRPRSLDFVSVLGRALRQVSLLATVGVLRYKLSGEQDNFWNVALVYPFVDWISTGWRVEFSLQDRVLFSLCVYERFLKVLHLLGISVWSH